MNEEICNIIKIYAKDTLYKENLKTLIDKLTYELEQTLDYQQTVMYDYYHVERAFYEKDDDKDVKINNEIIEPILKKTYKINITIERFEEQWSNGHDAEGTSEITGYDITYKLNEHNICFTLHYLVEEERIIHAKVKIDDWFEYILKNYTVPLGYYEEDGITGIQLYKKDEATLFYTELDENNIYKNKENFIRHLITAFFMCVFNESKLMYDETICIPTNLLKETKLK